MDIRTKPIDVQKALSSAAKLEVKMLNAGVEAMQVYINQAAKFSSLATDTLEAVQDDKATLSDTVRKFTDLGRQSVQAYADLAQRLGVSYYEELDRLADFALTSGRAEGPVATKSVSPRGRRKA